ncbi:MAG: hypothetical protein J6X28_04175 [Bacilli bacterium]|nr:hypothetical protein [Bacilli bacterium]
MRNQRKNTIVVCILFLILFLGLGYAFLTTTLNISGTTDVDSNTWNVYWDNVVVTEGSVSASTPVIDSSKTTVTFSVHLSKPGDFYEFTVDAKNDGSIDAMIDTITKTINNSTTVPSYLNYTVTYGDDEEIASKHLLEANHKEIYKVRVEYNQNIDANELPSEAASLSMSFGLSYIQADSSAVRLRTTVYSVSTTDFRIGFSIPDGETTYNTYQEAMDDFGMPFCIKHIVINDIIKESYVMFLKDNVPYELRVGGRGYNSQAHTYYGDSIYYESNKDILISAFGAENCSESSWEFHCVIPGLYASVSRNAFIAADFNDSTGGCASDDNKTNCWTA